jgi:hypothetical protein
MSGSSLIGWKLTFSKSPIYLTGSSSLTSGVNGSTVPLLSLISPYTGGQSSELDDYFADFQPMPGATLIDNAFATYPFANQSVAANAAIMQPLQVSMRMVVPARQPIGMWSRYSIMMSLQASLYSHNRGGGTYTVVTPVYVYTNCLMQRMHDISGGGGNQVQWEWQLDFIKPLLTQSEASSAQSSLMSKLSNGTQVTSSSWSGQTTGQSTPTVTTNAGGSAAGQTTQGVGWDTSGSGGGGSLSSGIANV